MFIDSCVATSTHADPAAAAQGCGTFGEDLLSICVLASPHTQEAPDVSDWAPKLASANMTFSKTLSGMMQRDGYLACAG